MTEGDELRRHRAFELVELRDPARRDELLQATRDSGADPAELRDATGECEIGHRRSRFTDRLGGATVRASRVEVRAGELKQASKCLETLGDSVVREVLRLGDLPPSPLRAVLQAAVGDMEEIADRVGDEDGSERSCRTRCPEVAREKSDRSPLTDAARAGE